MRGVPRGDAVGAVEREQLGQRIGAHVDEARVLPRGADPLDPGAGEVEVVHGPCVVGLGEVLLPRGRGRRRRGGLLLRRPEPLPVEAVPNAPTIKSVTHEKE